MIKFTYKHITRLIDLIELEIDRVENKKSRLSVNPTAINISMGETGTDTESFYMEDKRRLEKESELLNQLKDNFQRELDKLEFSFTAGDKMDANATIFSK